MKTIGHHTCSSEGEKSAIEQNAPFISTYIPDDEEGENNRHPFLGTGYYYWDNHIELAIWWGQVHYRGRYYIVKSNLEIDDGTFLDLVGSRASMIWLKDRIDELEEKGIPRTDWTLGNLIEFLKEIKTETGLNEVFPYAAIRSIDYKAKGKSNFSINFAPRKHPKEKISFTLLDPRMIICVIEKDESIIKTREIVYEPTA